ncbi:hypothetical protein BURCENBC7_AP6771 [Burkholderia cenocepacia BC7]|nr:hypothetical protein BURCENK562V_C1552 [Burkholderia cenocepacia K56-2Valvano]ERI26504.1 hypothetical protein BURCENBC7_AP6771 [Burkholderia cenocepacia BC7]
MTFPVRSANGMDDVTDTNGSAWWLPSDTRRHYRDNHERFL